MATGSGRVYVRKGDVGQPTDNDGHFAGRQFLDDDVALELPAAVDRPDPNLFMVHELPDGQVQFFSRDLGDGDGCPELEALIERGDLRYRIPQRGAEPVTAQQALDEWLTSLREACADNDFLRRYETEWGFKWWLTPERIAAEIDLNSDPATIIEQIRTLYREDELQPVDAGIPLPDPWLREPRQESPVPAEVVERRTADALLIGAECSGIEYREGHTFAEFADPDIARGLCQVAASIVTENVDLARYGLQVKGDGEAVMARGSVWHYGAWVEDDHGPFVIDFTIRQFSPDLPFPFVGTKTEWRRAVEDATGGVFEFEDVV